MFFPEILRCLFGFIRLAPHGEESKRMLALSRAPRALLINTPTS